MKKFPSMLCALACISGAASTANAANEATSKNIDATANIDSVLSDLRKKNKSSSLLSNSSFKSKSLANRSALLNSNMRVQNKKGDMLSHLTLVASNSVSRFKQSGRASWYGDKAHGKKTASGERFNMHAMTAAHKSLPFNSYVRVTNKTNGKNVVVKINDRAPAIDNHVLDMSYGAAKKLGIASRGVANVVIERINIH